MLTSSAVIRNVEAVPKGAHRPLRKGLIRRGGGGARGGQPLRLRRNQRSPVQLGATDQGNGEKKGQINAAAAGLRLLEIGFTAAQMAWGRIVKLPQVKSDENATHSADPSTNQVQGQGKGWRCSDH